MRIVPLKPTLNPVKLKCSTKLGRSLGPFRGSHSTAWPVSPAIEVKVPHSWAVSPGWTLTFCAFAARERDSSRAEKKIHARRREGPAGACCDEKVRCGKTELIALRPSLNRRWDCLEESFPPWSGF